MKVKKSLALLLSVILIITTLAPNFVFAEGNSVISVQSVAETAGASVDIDVSIKNNPGILGATLRFTYDDSLNLVGASSGDAFSALTMTRPGNLSSPCNFVWDGQDLDNNDIKDGSILKLTFLISDDAMPGTKCMINVSYEGGDIVDKNLNAVNPELESGCITVIDYLPGDLSGDKKINSTDIIMLRRHVVGKYEQKINELAGDVNGDGKYNSTDIIMLRRYVADGCQTLVNGYNIELKPGKPINSGCAHDLINIAYKAPTATEEGNIEYWHCRKCNKYFSDNTALTEIGISDTVIPKLTGHLITYDISNGDGYIADQHIQNPNPLSYNENEGLTLKNLSVPGYRFLGWYDGAGSNAVQIKKIEAGSTDDIELYAHWEKIVYTVQLKSDIFIANEMLTYTVDTGVALPTPKLSNYIFTGWSDEGGKLYRNTKIPAGTTGNIYLTANWTSERNKTWTKKTLDAPIIVENDTDIIFAYEIGQIQNVPLYTIKDFGYISGDGVTRTATESYSFKTDETLMSSYSKTSSNATTESSNWTLSSSWNDVTSVNEEWAKENGKDLSQVDVVAKNSTNNWNVSSGRSGSAETSTISTDNEGWSNQVQINGSKEHTESDGTSHKETDNKAWNINGNLSYTPKSYSAGVGFEGASVEASTSGGFGFEVGGGYEHSWGTEDETTHTETDSKKSGFELSGKKDVSSSSTESTVENSSWNSESSYGGSNSISESTTNSVNLSEKISQVYGYGHEYAKGEEQSQQQGHTSTQSFEDGYSSSVTYSLVTQEEKTNTWTTQATKPGYHRWIVAGTAHVFGVVGYNMLTNSYYVYTYSVMDDETHEFEDYSYTSAQYNDNENGVIPFEIPYEVAEYVSERTSASEGLKVNMEGIVTEYNGTDTCVVIPEYFNTGSGDIVKITGIATTAFRNNTDIEAVVLSDFITEIPDYAFEGCTSLIGVSGKNVMSIGEGAFSGCISVKECGVSSKVETLGERAFEGIEAIVVNASNADVVKAAAASGAKEIVICLEYLKDGESENSMDIKVPEGTRYFELNGDKNCTYSDLSVDSDADATVLNRVHIECAGKIPFMTLSPEVVLNQASIQSNGLAAVFVNDATRIGLQGTVALASENNMAMLCKQIELYEANEKVVGNLAVTQDILTCDDIINKELMSGRLEIIDNDDFDNYLKSRKIIFNLNGGEGSIEAKTVPYMGEYGELPEPRRDYYEFVGWYTEDGEEVTPETIMTSMTDVEIYAHWNLNSVSAWVLASEMPEDAEVVDRMWSYTKTHYTTSSSSSMSGWKQYDSTYVWSDYGNWSNWSTNDPGESTSRERMTRKTYRYYRYTCSDCKDHHPFMGECAKGSIVVGNYSHPHTCGYSGCQTVWNNYSEIWLESYPWTDGYYTWDHNYRCVLIDGYGSDPYADWTKVWWWVANDVKNRNEYKYRDRYKIYTYYFSKTETKEASEYPTEDNISNIVEYVQYRTK